MGQYKSKNHRPPLAKHAPGARASASSGSDAWRATPPTRMLIRKEDAASMTRLRVASGPPAKKDRGNAVQYDPQRPASTAR